MIWCDGAWLEDGAVAVSDRGFALGDGLFETMCWRDGAIVRLARHAARMQASAVLFGLPDPFDGVSLDALAADAASRIASDRLNLRYSVTAGSGPRGLQRPGIIAPARVFSAVPAGAPPATVSLALTDIRRSGSSLAARHKTLSYIDNVLAHRQARAAGADMALFLDVRGSLSGTDCANLYWVAGGQWHTPALECGVLAGTVRSQLLERGTVHETHAPLSALWAADCVMVSNAVIGLVPVSRVAGQAVRRDTAAAAELAGLID